MKTKQKSLVKLREELQPQPTAFRYTAAKEKWDNIYNSVVLEDTNEFMDEMDNIVNRTAQYEREDW